MCRRTGISRVASGFTLIEILVTAIILSTALLGLVMVQGLSKVSSYEARQRTLAMYVTNDMVERLRLNKSAWINTKLPNSGDTYSTAISSAALTLPGCATSFVLASGCSQSALVDFDLFNFQEQLLGTATANVNSALLAPTGCLALSRIGSNNMASVVITIAWQSKEKMNGSAQQSANVTCGTASQKHRQLVVRTVI